MMRVRTLGPLFLCLLLGAPAWASLPEIAGMGTRSPGLGGTGAAYLNGFEATYENPAGLLDVPRRLSVGVVYGGYRLTLDTVPHPIDATAGLLLGGALPLPLGGVLRDRLALGFGFYLPFGLINRARDPFPEVPRAALLDNRTQVISVLVGAAARLPRNITVGVSVLALAALVGEIVIGQDGSGRISSATQEQLTVNYAPIVGLRWHTPDGRWSVGGVFRGVSQSSYSTAVKSQLGNILPIDLPTININGVAQYDPLQAAAEVAWAPSATLLLIANLTWKHYSAYDNPVQPATQGADPLPPTSFHDTVVPRVAVEWQPPGLHWAGAVLLRLGYFFEWSPAPSDEQGRALLDASRHVVCAGLSHRVPGRVPLLFDAYLQWHQLSGSERLTGGFALGGISVGLDL